jgi:predicted protein tyrosine phosphatase
MQLVILIQNVNILFICSRNQWRSRTAETIFKNNKNHLVKSAGTEPGARIRVSAELITWSDIIFVMEKRHRQRLNENFPGEMQNKDVSILDIADDYGYMDEELIEIIKTSVTPYL